jgi:membrane-associated phospholipid phosphatase
MTTFFLGLVLLMFCLPVRADAIRTAGDWLQIGIPAFALGRAHGLGDSEGVRQAGSGIVTNMLATQSLKLATDQTRPDGGNLSFPSGHTSAAFQGAAFLHRRYGWDEAWPHYLAAGFVGYSRVHARRHRWRDVIGGAAVGIGSSWLTATPRDRSSLTLALEGDSVQARYTRTW